MIRSDRFYGVQELRQETHAPRQLIYSALEAGELRGWRRGRRWLIPGASALAWLEGLAFIEREIGGGEAVADGAE